MYLYGDIPVLPPNGIATKAICVYNIVNNIPKAPFKFWNISPLLSNLIDHFF